MFLYDVEVTTFWRLPTLCYQLTHVLNICLSLPPYHLTVSTGIIICFPQKIWKNGKIVKYPNHPQSKRCPTQAKFLRNIWQHFEHSHRKCLKDNTCANYFPT